MAEPQFDPSFPYSPESAGSSQAVPSFDPNKPFQEAGASTPGFFQRAIDLYRKTPSWLEQASQEAKTGAAAYQQGGVPALMSRIGPTEELAGGFIGSPILKPNAPIRPPTGPLGVTLSAGQETGNIGAIRREQAALRSGEGPAADRAAQFKAQQAAQVSAAQERIARGLDPYGGIVAQSPQEAGAIVQTAVQSEAARAKANVGQSYEQARGLPGEINAGVFEGIGQKIKGDLSLGDNPVIIDELTPRASKAIDYLDNQISQLKIKNKADPFGPPNQENIVGVSLTGIEQWRKYLSALKRDAYSSGNATDGRAAKAVLDSFDEHINNAVNSGMFRGDQAAVKAWNDARAAHADYKTTFGKQKNDPVGRDIERVLGTSTNPAAIPNDVADFIYGGTGVNPNSRNVAFANRVKVILGENSPEWIGVKQGLFSRLVETPPGVKDIGSGTIANRVSQFISGSGKELAATVFSPAEQSLLKQYADLHRALEVPQAGPNWSNNAPYIIKLTKMVSNGLSTVIGGILGHLIAPGAYGTGEAIGALIGSTAQKTIGDTLQARQIAKQMPLVSEATRKWQRAVTAYNKSDNPVTRVALSVATSNMSGAFKNIGIDLAGPGVSRASEPDQQPVPRGIGQ